MSTTITAQIESYEVQPNNIIRLSTLFKLFQKAAGDDLDSTGITYEVLREHGIVFVITKNTIKFFDDIKNHDTVKIVTRPRGCRGVSFIRDFDVFVDDKRVAYASSSWVLMDINNRRLLRPNAIDIIGSIPTDSDEILELEDKRIKLDANSLQRTDVRKVYYSQIDTNGHMNNTFYPDIVYDYLPDEYKTSLKDKLLSVYYIAEAMRGEKIDIYSHISDNQFKMLAKNLDSGRDIFTAIVDF